MCVGRVAPLSPAFSTQLPARACVDSCQGAVAYTCMTLYAFQRQDILQVDLLDSGKVTRQGCQRVWT
jgi:hypothetical protein